MKINYALVWAVLFSLPGYLWSQQASSYALSVSNSAYVELGPSATAVSILGDGLTEDVPIGFNFSFEGMSYDTLAVSSDGFASFVKGVNSSYTNDLDNGSAGRRPLLAPLWDDLDGRASSSAASYELSGSAPNRVFTMEWRDWEWNWISGDSVVSFQLKLYESSNEIEFHYRWECDSCLSGASASIGLSGATSFLSVGNFASGTPTASSNSESSSIDTVVTDQVLRFVPPACSEPNLDSIANLTSTGFDVHWSGSGSDDVVINWGPAGFNQATATTQSLDTTNAGMYAISGLTEGLLYDVYLKRLCTGSSSIWLGPISVRTTCGIKGVPYNESFDFDLGCFSISDGGSTSDTWFWTADDSGDNVDGNPGFAFVDSDAAGSGTSLDEFLSSPVIDASNLTGTLMLEFDQYYRNLGCNADVEVYDGSSWVTVLSQSSTTGAWSAPDHQSIDITAYANANLQVRFHYYNANWAYYWAIDNFSVTEVLCNSSSNLGVVAASSDSITINWNSGSGSSYGVEYGPAGFSPGSGTLVGVTDTFYTATGLNPSTPYDFYVIDSCGATMVSQLAGPLSTSTTCTTVPMPFNEDFETWPLSCWDSTASQDFYWDPYGSAPDRVARANFWGNSSGTAVIASRPITITQDAQVRFYWSHKYSTTYPDDQFVVRVKSLGSAVWDTLLNLQGSTFDDLGASNTTPGSYTEEILLLDPATYTGNDLVIEFHGVTDYGPVLFLNDINVEAIPACAKAQNLRDTNTSAFESTLAWDDLTGLGSSYQVWFGPQGFYQGTQTTAGVKTISNVDTLFIDTLSGSSCYEFLVRSICSANDSSEWAGPFSFCTPPSCPSPTDITVFNNQLNSVDLNWTSGGASDYNVSVVSPGAPVSSGTMYNATANNFNVGGLSAGTTYEVYVRDSCGPGDVSVWTGPVLFNTAYSTNFLETFDTNAFANPIWTEADGYLTANTVFTSSSSSSWNLTNFGNNGSNTTAARVNIYSSNQYEWIISPSIYLDPSITNLQVEFDAAITEWINTNQGYFGSDDSLALVVSTDNGQSWSKSNVLWTADANDTLDASGEHFIVPLTGYSGYVKFAFYAGSVVHDPEDNDWFIDNFEVRTPRPCASPSALSADGITTSSAVARWTPGDTNAIAWDLILSQPNQPASAGTVYPATAYDSLVLTGLNSGSPYCFYIVEECASGFSDTIGPHCFNTLCSSFTAPYYEDFETGGFCWSNDIVSGNQEWTIGAGSIGGSINNAYAGSFNARFTSSGAPADTTRFISPVIDVSNLNSVELSFYYAQESWAGDQNILKVYYRDNASAAWSMLFADSSDVPTWTYFDTIIPSSSSTLQIAFEGIDNWGRSNVIDEVRIQEASCPQPTALMLSSANCDTLTIDWSSQSGGSIIQYGPAGFNPGSGTYTNIVTAPYAISGLPLDSDFDIWVADTCGGDTTAFVGPITVSTDSIGPLVASFTANSNNVTATTADVSFDASASTNAVSYSWDFDNGNTGTGQTNTETYSSNGSYDVVLTVTDRCGNTDDTTLTVLVQGISLEESLLSTDLSIYPNPNQGAFRLELPNTGSDFTLEVSDLSGKVIFTKEALSSDSNYDIQLPEVSKGVYMIHLQSGNQRITKRLIVE